MLQFNCPNCAKLYETDDSYAGSQLICDDCGMHFFIPAIDDINDVIYEYSSPFEDKKKFKLNFASLFKKIDKKSLIIMAVILLGAFCIAGYFQLRRMRLIREAEQQYRISQLAAEIEKENEQQLHIIKEELDEKIVSLKDDIPSGVRIFQQYWEALLSDYRKGCKLIGKNYSECELFFSKAQKTAQWLEDNIPRYHELYKKLSALDELKQLANALDKKYAEDIEIQEVVIYERYCRNGNEADFARKLDYAERGVEKFREYLKDECTEKFSAVSADTRKNAAEKKWEQTLLKCRLILLAFPENEEFLKLRKVAEYNLQIKDIADEIKVYKDFPQRIIPLVNDFIKMCNSSVLSDKNYIDAEIIDIYKHLLQSKKKKDIVETLQKNSNVITLLKNHDLFNRIFLQKFRLQAIKYAPLKMTFRGVSERGPRIEFAMIEVEVHEQKIRNKLRPARKSFFVIGDRLYIEAGIFIISDLKKKADGSYDLILRDREGRKIVVQQNKTAYSHCPVAELYDILNEKTVSQEMRSSLRVGNSDIGFFHYRVAEINRDEKYMIIYNRQNRQRIKISADDISYL